MELTQELSMKRCPHCNIANPTIRKVHEFDTNNANRNKPRKWVTYTCHSCGGAIIGSRTPHHATALEVFPSPKNVDESIPDRAKQYLSQSLETLHAPAGSIMLSASAIDSMLKEKGYKDGSLYSRIEKAAKDHLITEGMAQWAHQIRLEANDQRHADDNASLPTEEDAKRVVEFAIALGEFLFVLPNRVQSAIERTKG